MDVFDCQRCEDGVAISCTGLLGGVSASLCPACLTAWHTAITGSPLWQRFLALDARESHYRSLASAGAPVTETDWLTLGRDRCAAEREAFAVGLEFVKPINP